MVFRVALGGDRPYHKNDTDGKSFSGEAELAAGNALRGDDGIGGVQRQGEQGRCLRPFRRPPRRSRGRSDMGQKEISVGVMSKR